MVVVALVTVVVGVLVVGEAPVPGVSVGAGDGAAGSADRGGCRRCRCCSWEGGWDGAPVSRGVAPPVARLLRVMWASVDGAGFGGVAEGGVRVAAGDAGSVVADVLVVSACGPWSQVVNRAMPPVRLVQVVSVTVRLLLLVRAVRLSYPASVALVMLMVMLVSPVLRVSASLVTLLVVCWRYVPVVVLQW